MCVGLILSGKKRSSALADPGEEREILMARGGCTALVWLVLAIWTASAAPSSASIVELDRVASSASRLPAAAADKRKGAMLHSLVQRLRGGGAVELTEVSSPEVTPFLSVSVFFCSY